MFLKSTVEQCRHTFHRFIVAETLKSAAAPAVLLRNSAKNPPCPLSSHLKHTLNNGKRRAGTGCNACTAQIAKRVQSWYTDTRKRAAARRGPGSIKGGRRMIIVGICGASGSGKSTLAKRISDSLACSCVIIGQDCYYRNFPELPLEKRVTMNYDEPGIFDFDEMFEDVVKLEHGEPIVKKGYDYTNYLRADSSDEFIQPPEVLILEGIHMFHDKRICEMMALKVFLHVDVDVCLLRRIKRDIKARGRNIDNIYTQYLETVKPVYETYISHYIDDADFAVMRGGKNKMAIDAISAYLTTKVLAERFEPGNGQQAAPRPEGGEDPAAHAAVPAESHAGEPAAQDKAKSEAPDDGEYGGGELASDPDTDEEGEEEGRVYPGYRGYCGARPRDWIGYGVALIAMNFFIGIFGIFMFGKVLGFDWTILQSGGLKAMLDAVVQVFFLFVPLLVTIFFNRFLYRSFRLDRIRSGAVTAAAVVVIVAMQALAIFLILRCGFMGGASTFGVASLAPYPLW